MTALIVFFSMFGYAVIGVAAAVQIYGWEVRTQENTSGPWATPLPMFGGLFWPLILPIAVAWVVVIRPIGLALERVFVNKSALVAGCGTRGRLGRVSVEHDFGKYATKCQRPGCIARKPEELAS